MPKLSTTKGEVSNKFLRPYQFHGLDLTEKGNHALANCPFCGREVKFSIEITTGLWRCLVCASGSEKGGGNIVTFMRLLHERSLEYTNEDDYEPLREHRKLLGKGTLKSWGVCKSTISNNWIIPGYSADRKLINLYKYVEDIKTKKWLLLATTDQPHGIMLSNDYDKNRSIVNMMEGPWDAMAFWESFGSDEVNVVAMAGCGSIGEPLKKLTPIFAGKQVRMFFDSDHPRELNGKFIEGAGYSASKRATRIFANVEEPPTTLKWLEWGPTGFDENRPHGWDVRDVLTQFDDRKAAAQELHKRCVPVPEDWLEGRSTYSAKNGKTEIECLPCTSWKELTNAWRKAMTWTEGLDRALSIMLASILSVRSKGDQLWLRVIGPASCGKSTLCEAISVNKKRVIAKSTLKGFHSGWKEGDGSDNKSLILKMRNKTLVIKDADPLIQSPNREQIIGEARDLFDSTSRSDFKNGMGMDHEGIRCTLVLCGTSAIRQLDTSELGARWIDCVIMEEIDEDLEDEINMTILHRAKRNVSLVSDSHKQEDCIDPDMLKAMQMTGGYIDYLCNNAEEITPRVDDMEPHQDRLVVRLAKFVAYMRARPSLTQDEKAEREFSGRLVSQLTRLTMCLTPVLGLKKVSQEVMRRVRHSAMDTAKGKVFDVCKHLYHTGQMGKESESLRILMLEQRDKLSSLLKFMSKIGIVEFVEIEVRGGMSRRWRLTERFSRLYKEVIIDAESNGVH